MFLCLYLLPKSFYPCTMRSLYPCTRYYIRCLYISYVSFISVRVPSACLYIYTRSARSHVAQGTIYAVSISPMCLSSLCEYRLHVCISIRGQHGHMWHKVLYTLSLYLLCVFHLCASTVCMSVYLYEVSTVTCGTRWGF
jgi:hypothetical protein